MLAFHSLYSLCIRQLILERVRHILQLVSERDECQQCAATFYRLYRDIRSTFFKIKFFSNQINIRYLWMTWKTSRLAWFQKLCMFYDYFYGESSNYYFKVMAFGNIVRCTYFNISLGEIERNLGQWPYILKIQRKTLSHIPWQL